MRDLTLIDEGNPNLMQDGLINFLKCDLIYKSIRDVQMYQVQSYSNFAAKYSHLYFICFCSKKIITSRLSPQLTHLFRHSSLWTKRPLINTQSCMNLSTLCRMYITGVSYTYRL